MHPDNDLLRRNWCVILLLDDVARERTAKRARHHRHVAATAPANQAPNTEACQATNDSTDSGMVVVS